MARSAATQPVYAAADVLPRLRRIALYTQGLAAQAAFGRGKAGAYSAISHLGYVQIDTISVVERAHHHVLRSRVPGYRPDHLHALLAEGRIFEYWSHAAAFLPMRDYRFALPLMARYRQGDERWIRGRNRDDMHRIIERIRVEGPLRTRDFDDEAAGRSGWWDWKPAKKALEQLFMEGELMVVARDGFQKTYDLTERVLPASVDTTPPSQAEYAAHIVDSTLRAHGCAQQPTFTHLRRGAPLRKAVNDVLVQQCAEGTLARLAMDDGQTWFVRSDLWERRIVPPRGTAVRVLSPFDNSVIHRTRGQRLFNFDYAIECYVPEPKRRYGYFCLPLLHRDRFIGRVDAKAHRRERRLEIRHLHLDLRLDDAMLDALAQGLREFAGFNECEEIDVTRVTPATAKRPIRQALSDVS